MKNGFEKQLTRLEEIVSKLEEEQTDLDASVKLFEEGIALSKELTQQLQEVKFKVSALKKKGAALLSEPFDAPQGDADESDHAE